MLTDHTFWGPGARNTWFQSQVLLLPVCLVLGKLDTRAQLLHLTDRSRNNNLLNLAYHDQGNIKLETVQML